MFDASNPVTILVPMLVVVALTLVALLRMGAGRAGAMKSGIDPRFYKAHQGGQEPEHAVVGVRHYHNLLELPTLFYAACLTAFVLGAEAIGDWTLILAWGYVVMRLIQSAIHLTYNNPAHRGGAYMVGALLLFGLWVNVGLEVFARV